jgi:RNA polymerase sigma-70 factor (ECF subfamily)
VADISWPQRLSATAAARLLGQRVGDSTVAARPAPAPAADLPTTLGTPDLTAAVAYARDDGDEGAFCELYRAVQPSLLRYLRVLVGEENEDVASEAWLQVARDLPSFRGDFDGFRRWVVTIARHRALDHLRRKRRRPRTGSAADQLNDFPASEDTAGQALDAISTDAAIAMIASLPREQAEAVLLRVVMGLDAKACGQVLGKRAGAVRTAVYRGLHRLGEGLDRAVRVDHPPPGSSPPPEQDLCRKCDNREGPDAEGFEMGTNRHLWGKRSAIGQALDGAAHPQALADLLAAAAAPGRADELAGERAALAAFRTARLGPVTEHRRPSMIQSMLAKILTAKIAAATAAATAAGGAALAAGTDSLPQPLQAVVPGVFHVEGTVTVTPVPSASPTANPTASPSASPSPSQSGTARQLRPRPSLVGLCWAYLRHNRAHPNVVPRGQAFTFLITTAGGRDKVVPYCVTVLKNRIDKLATPSPSPTAVPTLTPTPTPTPTGGAASPSPSPTWHKKDRGKHHHKGRGWGNGHHPRWNGWHRGDDDRAEARHQRNDRAEARNDRDRAGARGGKDRAEARNGRGKHKGNANGHRDNGHRANGHRGHGHGHGRGHR